MAPDTKEVAEVYMIELNAAYQEQSVEEITDEEAEDYL